MTRAEDERRTRSIEVSMSIDAPIEAVWKALTEASELVRWFPLEAGENPDGTLWMSWGDGFRFEGRVSESASPHRLRSVYHQPPPGRDPATLKPEDFAEISTEYVLETEGGKTLLRLVHSGFGAGADWDDQFDATRTGWWVELRGLRHYLENHRGRDRIVAWAKAPFSSTRQDAWSTLMSKNGLLAEGTLDPKGEGSPYRIVAANGDRFEGIVKLLDPPRNFVATALDWNDALVRLRLDDLYGQRQAHLWLSAYGVPSEDVRSFQERWQRELARLISA